MTSFDHFWVPLFIGSNLGWNYATIYKGVWVYFGWMWWYVKWGWKRGYKSGSKVGTCGSVLTVIAYESGSKVLVWTTFGNPYLLGQIEGHILVSFSTAWEGILGVSGGMWKVGEKGGQKVGQMTIFGPLLRTPKSWTRRQKWSQKCVKSGVFGHFWGTPIYRVKSRVVLCY